MSIAVTKGKISRSGNNLTSGSEDLLTASVFGPLRYLPSRKLLIPILKQSVNLNGDSYLPMDTIPDSDIHVEFWPKHDKSEPDLSISFGEKELIFIESKFKSGKSGSYNNDDNLSEEESNESASSDQLSREFMDLCANSHQKRTLIYLTAHRIKPKEDLETSAKAYYELNDTNEAIFTENTYWLSWYDIWNVATQKFSGDDNSFHAIIIKDIVELLERLGLKHFNGFKSNEENIKESYSSKNPLFYTSMQTKKGNKCQKI